LAVTSSSSTIPTIILRAGKRAWRSASHTVGGLVQTRRRNIAAGPDR
jgi:hypothetical protein